MFNQLWKDMKSTGILFYMIALQLASLLFVTGKGAGQIYLDMFLILLLITLTAFFFTRIIGGNDKVVIYGVILITIGIMLQVIFKQESIMAKPDLYATGNPAAGLQLQYIVALAAAIGASFLYRKGKFLARPNVIKGLYLLSIVLYLFTLVFAKAVGNAKNWIVIGGFSIQTSEINKLLYIFILSGILGGVEKPSKKRIGFAFLVTLTNLFFLALQSEFGTILLLLVVFPVYLLLFVPDIKVVLGTIAGYIGMGAAVAGVGTLVTKLAAGSETFAGMSIVRYFLSNYNKIANRVIYWLYPERDPMGMGYQILKAKEAILLGGWFGTDSISDLPVKTSDMVFPALIERCGMIVAVLVLIVIVLLWLEGIRVFIRKKDKYHRAVCAGIVFMLFYQALIIVGGSCGMCPLTGITLPFISSGGSSLLISSIMIGIVITISGKLEWEGELENEEMELEFKLFKKNTDCPESFHVMCHRYASVINQNLRSFAGGFRRSGSGKTGRGICPEPEGVCEGSDCGPEWGDIGQFEDTTGGTDLYES